MAGPKQFETFPVIGILGGGQLGRMTALAAIRMGIKVRFLVPAPSGPVADMAGVTEGDWTDPAVLKRFAEACDVVTVESEWAPADVLEPVLPPGAALWPSVETIQAIRHKGIQKSRLRDAGLPVPDFVECTSLSDAGAAAERFGYPVLVKQYRGSYDGYGNATVRNGAELERAWQDLAAEDGALVERWVDFRRELAVLVARRPDGVHVVYPVAETEQRHHRCHAVTVPAPIDAGTARQAAAVGLRAVEAVGGVGLTAVELFEAEDGRILVNELAPRPHNTGHYSIDACHTSQFENHVRGILGLPLGDPSLKVPHAVMVNVLGQREGMSRAEGFRDALAEPGVSVHLYGKEDVRPNRKMGHVTVCGANPEAIRQRAERAAAAINL